MSATERATPQPRPYSRSGLYIKAASGLKLRDRKVTRLAVKVRAALPWLEPSDGPTVRAWCELEYLCNQVHAALRAFGPTNARGEARRLLDDYRKLRSVQLQYSKELGMTPLTRQALRASSADAALDLAAMAASATDVAADAQDAAHGADVAQDAASGADDGRDDGGGQGCFALSCPNRPNYRRTIL